jgi:hypothetical protein
LTIRKDLRNIDLKSLYFGGHYRNGTLFGFSVYTEIKVLMGIPS